MFPAGRSNDFFRQWFKDPRGVKILNGQRTIKHCHAESATESNTINGYQRAMLSAMWLIYFAVWDTRNSQSVAGGSPQPFCLISTASRMLLSSPTSKTTTLVNCLSGVYGRTMLFCAKWSAIVLYVSAVCNISCCWKKKCNILCCINVMCNIIVLLCCGLFLPM